MVPSTSRLAAVHPLSAPIDGLSDAELVARIRAGEPRFERLLYLKHAGYVLSLCLRLLGHREEAEDAAQDIFLAVLEELASLRDPSRLRPWIAQIAVHKIHRRFRRRKMLRALGLWEPSSQAVELLPAAAGASQEQAAELGRLSRVLATLDDEVRAAWVLRYVDGHKLEEVASLCRCSLATAKRRVATGDAVVRRHVQLEELSDA